MLDTKITQNAFFVLGISPIFPFSNNDKRYPHKIMLDKKHNNKELNFSSILKKEIEILANK